MFPAGNKAKPVSSVSHTRKGIHHHHRIRQIIRFESIFCLKFTSGLRTRDDIFQ